MADDTNFRSYRQNDPHGRPITPTASGREGGSDPLAELARLIGQTDPFADLGRGGSPGAAPRAQNPYGAPPVPHPFDVPPFDRPSQPGPGQDFQPAYDPAIYGSAPQDGAPSSGGYVAQAYYEDPAAHEQGDEGYDEPPRRGLRAILILMCLALLGAGGAFGYRAIFVGGGSATPPPVIKADTAPSKIVPAPSGEPSNKIIYDRVGDPAQGERVVSREEKPVDVKEAAQPPARVVFPGLPASPDRQDAAAASAPLGSMPPGPASSEPKKIRTVTIRPDQPLADASAPRTVVPAPAPRNTTPPPANAPQSLAPGAPAAPEAARPAAAARGNAPLSLNPQVANAEAPAVRPAPPPAAAPTPAAAPARIASVSGAAVEAGAYTVQISSQRSEAEAQASFRSLQAKFPSLLGNRQPIVRRADLGDKGIYFRAMVGPFASLDQASQFCGSLKSAGGQCVVQRN